MKLTFAQAWYLKNIADSIFLKGVEIKFINGTFFIDKIKIVPHANWVLNPFDSPEIPENKEGEFDLLVQFDANTVLPFCNLFNNENIVN